MTEGQRDAQSRWQQATRRGCCHRRRRRRDRGRRQRRLTNGMEKDTARREDDNKDDKGRSKESGRQICRPGQKTGGLVGCRCVRPRATATSAAAGGSSPDDGADKIDGRRRGPPQ